MKTKQLLLSFVLMISASLVSNAQLYVDSLGIVH